MAEIPQILTSDPVEMFALGRRHLAVEDYSAAASCLAKACELLAEKHGQQADECGEACFWYGKALLNLAREESGVLGDGVPGNDENQEEDEEDDENEAEDNQETDNINEDKTENSLQEKTEEDKSEQKMDVCSSDQISDTTSLLSNTDQPGPSGGTTSSAIEGESVENEDDEVENLQLAWEVFELARDIFLKRGDRGKSELAEVYLHLGEVSLESEVYDKAISDMGKSLELFKELYSADDRRIAETHYQIGLAHSLSNGFDDAITHFKSAVEILENRIKNLQKPEASEDESIKKILSVNPFYTIDGEIKELTELLPEIREKIQDTMDYKAEAIKSVRETLNLNKANGESSKTNGCTSLPPQEDKKASDISHLIKRKRKSEDNSAEDCRAPKKPAN